MYLEGLIGQNLDLSSPKLTIATWEWGPYLGEEFQKIGIHMKVLAVDSGIPVIEEQFTRDQLYIADEMFITGTAADIVTPS